MQSKLDRSLAVGELKEQVELISPAGVGECLCCNWALFIA